VIVWDGQILAESPNRVAQTHDPTAPAPTSSTTGWCRAIRAALTAANRPLSQRDSVAPMALILPLNRRIAAHSW